MHTHALPSESDTVLLPYLQATEEKDAQRHLERLLHEHADPTVQGILERRERVSLRGRGSENPSLEQENARDLYCEAIAQLLVRLRQIRANPQSAAIADFRAYAAVVTYRTWHQSLRKKYPQRASLRNRLRYLLTHQPGLALWESDAGACLCGLVVWRGQAGAPAAAERLSFWQSDGRALTPAALAHQSLVDLVPALLNEAGGPVELEDLVQTVADLWGVRDQPAQTGAPEDASEDPCQSVADPHTDVAAKVDQHCYLRALWTEICLLPPRQRAALLLNLRDGQGRGIIALLPLVGFATLPEIASALDLCAERLAALWQDLPMEDAAIAPLLGVTRQQVIDLRKVARKRLARRMQAWERQR